MIDKRLDGYEAIFNRGEEDALIAEVKEMEENSEWVPDIKSAGMELEAIDGPLFAKDACDKFHLNYELALDTVDLGTSLVINTGYEYQLLRDTAKPSLCETAKLYGSALGRMKPFLFAETINNGLQVARGSTLMLMRYGKASALHSNADGGYEVMPISELLDITTDMINRRFGTGDFIQGYNNHGYTMALWELPDAQEQILKIYQKALNGVRSLYPVNFMPAIRFASSDTAASCATLEPLFYVPKTNAAVRFSDGVKIRHTKRGAKVSAMEEFRAQAEDMFARFEESAEMISKLANIPIYNGCNAVVSICKKLGIAKKYGETARVEMEHLMAGLKPGEPISAHDLYLCMTEVLAEAENCDASTSVMRNLEECIAKVPKADWSEHDVGGVVSW